jgi:small-conductance mechanosensitive channel
MARFDPGQLVGWSQALSSALLHGGVALAIGLGLHLALFGLLDRLAKLSPGQTDNILFARLRQPVRWSLVAVALAIAAENDPLLSGFWGTIARFVVPALMGWTAYALVKAFAAILEDHAERGVDEAAVRSRRTRVTLLSRSAAFLIVVVTVALVLFNIPGVRNVGVTLLASAGMITLVLGVAAQPALKSLIAGIQMALTEPIRIGDFVVVEGESGRIEDIRLSYVIVRTADERRIIVPTSKFLDSSFQNWTRVGGGITGSVVLPVRPGHPVGPIREAYLGLLDAQQDWDRRTGSLQVSEIRPGMVELKLIMSASDPTRLQQLRSTMRESMLEWLRTEMPDALCDTA